MYWRAEIVINILSWCVVLICCMDGQFGCKTQKHTHAHTHTHTHAYTYRHTQSQSQMLTHTYTQTIQGDEMHHTYQGCDGQASTHTRTHSRARTDTVNRMRWTLRCSSWASNTHTHTVTQTCTHTHAPTHTHTHSLSLSHADTRTHTHTHTHTHIYAHTQSAWVQWITHTAHHLNSQLPDQSCVWLIPWLVINHSIWNFLFYFPWLHSIMLSTLA